MWRSIISQTNIFNIFLACVPFNSVKKILEMNCNKKVIKKYVPQKSVWMNRLFIDPANKSKKVCLTIDCSSIDPVKPGRFKTDAGKPDFQTCYLGNDKQIYDVFISRRLKEENFNNRIYFKIERIKSKTNNETFNARFELKNFKNGVPNVRSAKSKYESEFHESESKRKTYGRSGRSRSTRPKFLHGQ